MRRNGRHRRHPAALTWPLLAAAVVAACTTPGVKPDPANAPNAVVSSVDRIRDGQIRVGGLHPCLEDEWCAAGLTRVYGLQLGSGSIAFDTPAATLSALNAGAVDVGAFPASAVETDDPRITILRDDRSLQPADNIVPVVAGALVAAGGHGLATAVDDVSATLDTAGLEEIERALAGGSAPDLAAADWLDHHPPIPAPVHHPPVPRRSSSERRPTRRARLSPTCTRADSPAPAGRRRCCR